jgi:hypothetical protein
MKLQSNKFGLTQNPIGGHCTMRHGERLLIGEVKSVYRNNHGYTLLKVKHFDGSNWPLDPSAMAVDMLDRDHEAQQ